MCCTATPVRLVPPNMSLYYSFHFGHYFRGLFPIFLKLFQTPKSALDSFMHRADAGALALCNFRKAHAEQEMRGDPVSLFLRQGSKRLIQPGIFLLLFKHFGRCQNDHQRITLHAGIVVQGKICLVPICTQNIAASASLYSRSRSATSSGTSTTVSFV